MGFRLGIDVGGTFTDVVLLNEETGDIRTLKVPSSRENPAAPVIEGAKMLVEREGVDASTIVHVVHGCTIATNAVIERTGVRTGLVVTRGFRGMLEIGRQETIDGYSFANRKAQPLVPKGLVLEVSGRLSSSGDEIESLSVSDLQEAAAAFETQDVRAIAVSLLNAFRNPVHEREAVAFLRRRLPGVIVLAGTDLWPEIGEYERAYVAILNGYIMPLMDSYMQLVESGLKRTGIVAPILVPKLNGGVATLARTSENPIATITSGLTAGAQAAAHVCRIGGIERAITLDIGGTSADFAFIEHGEPVFSADASVGGYPVAMPSVWVRSVGAGGGSVAWVDDTHTLKVGPRSAGSMPGPACYGKGGQAATVTDAYLICGYLSPDTLLAGNMRLDLTAAERAISTLAREIGASVKETAESIIRITTSLMTREIASMLSQKGVDPRDSTLIAFGGAGPTHAHSVIDDLNLLQAVIPRYPGTLCALGGVLSPLKEDAIRSFNVALERVEPGELRRTLEELRNLVTARLRQPGLPEAEAKISYSADMRYRRQAYTLNVPLSDEVLERAALAEAFHEQHQRVYRRAAPDTPVTLVNLRVTGVAPLSDIVIERDAPVRSAGPIAHRLLYHRGVDHEAPVYRRGDLAVGMRIEGPVIVEQADTTSVVPPGYECTVNPNGLMTISKRREPV